MPSSVPSRFIEVWRLALDEVDVAAAGEVLDGAEMHQAGRLATAELRQRFLARRVALRQILAERLGTTAGALRISYPPGGKPHLSGAGAMQFSASHSGATGLVALCGGAAVGVDLERRRPVADWQDTARHFFHAAERRHVLAAPDDPSGFLLVWTRKEAVLKACGLGLSVALDGFAVVDAAGRPLRTVRVPGATRAAAEWCVADLDLGTDYVGALAMSAESVDQSVSIGWQYYPHMGAGAMDSCAGARQPLP